MYPISSFGFNFPLLETLPLVYHLWWWYSKGNLLDIIALRLLNFDFTPQQWWWWNYRVANHLQTLKILFLYLLASITANEKSGAGLTGVPLWAATARTFSLLLVFWSFIKMCIGMTDFFFLLFFLFFGLCFQHITHLSQLWKKLSVIILHIISPILKFQLVKYLLRYVVMFHFTVFITILSFHTLFYSAFWMNSSVCQFFL